MPYSMTAFARHADEGDWGRAVWELRSVNNRYLDVNFRLPEELRGLEAQFRDQIATRLKRGKVDCTLKFSPPIQQESLNINLPLVKQLATASKQIAGAVYETAPLNPLDVMRWPGVLETAELDLDLISTGLASVLDKTLQTLLETRHREGSKMAGLITTRCHGANAEVKKIRQQMPVIIRTFHDKLLEKVEELASRLDETRMEQEIALLVQKMDVEEELDRLETHINEVLRVLQQEGPMGRQLDFLMQEMNREANTLGSKSVNINSTETSITLKVLIEQMREQIQNIE